jgi:carbohydrate kinase (thermoresistant glucokinase family)
MLSSTDSVPTILVIMGVSGSGKTTIATLLAKSLGWPFRDADEFHPKANIEKMKSGVPLTDKDRLPWLDAIAAWIDQELARRASAIVTCSALKRSYRDIIIDGRKSVRLIYLKGEKALLEARLAGRHSHFMPSSLLQSQFDDLQEPGADEHALTVSVEATPDSIVAQILDGLGLRPPR